MEDANSWKYEISLCRRLLVDVPELVGCMSQGKALDDELTNIKDVIK